MCVKLGIFQGLPTKLTFNIARVYVTKFIVLPSVFRNDVLSFFFFLFRYFEYVKTSEDSFKCLASMFRKPQKYSVKRLDVLKFSVEILEISKVQFQGVVSPKSRALRRCNCEKFGARGFTSRGSSLSKCRRI